MPQTIELACFAMLAEYTPPGGRFETAEGAVVADVLRALCLPAGAVVLMFINGVRAEESDTLRDGDRLSLLPLVDGG